MNKRVDLPTLDKDNKSVIQVMKPSYTQTVTNTSIECKTKIFRIAAGTGGCTITFKPNNVAYSPDNGIVLAEGSVEYFGAEFGDYLTITGTGYITWSR